MLLDRLSGESDSTVTVAETRLAGANDHVLLSVTHTGMQFSGPVAEQACAFLKNGRFYQAGLKPVPVLITQGELIVHPAETFDINKSISTVSPRSGNAASVYGDR